MEFGLRKHSLRRHPRTKRSGVKSTPLTDDRRRRYITKAQVTESLPAEGCREPQAAHGGSGTPWWLASARRKESACIQSYRLYTILDNHAYSIYPSHNLSLHLDYTRSPSPDFRRELPPQGAEQRFRSTKNPVKFRFCGLFVFLKHPLRCHPRTKRSGVKDLAQAPTARPNVCLFKKVTFAY